MAGMLRRAAARTNAVLPLRGAGAGPIKPIGPNFPLTSEKAMGPHGWMRGSYHFWSLSNPIVGPLYRPPWVVGGIHNPTIDPVKRFVYNLLPARVMWLCVHVPLGIILFWTWVEQ